MSGTASNVSDDVASKQSSTLSRNALYTPLMAFEQTNVDPSSYMMTRKNIPSSLRESSLVDFIQTVSEITEKPLSFQAVEERIRQRALTLVGGGINSSMTGQQSKRQRRRRRHEQVSNRQRKRILRDAKEKEQSSNKVDKQHDVQVFNTLLQVHEKWKSYVCKLAGVREDASTFTDSCRATLSKRLAHVELVGGFVRLLECKAHKAWVGKEGLIVGITVNTWRLAIMRVSADDKQKQQPKVLVVPKQGSKLMFQLPMKDGSSPFCVVVNGDGRET